MNYSKLFCNCTESQTVGLKIRKYGENEGDDQQIHIRQFCLYTR